MLDSPPHPLLTQSDSTGSGASTPPLWTSDLSPSSRTQAILRGETELMEMVHNMPESSYELSLKDLVHLHTPPCINSVMDSSCLGKQQQHHQQEGLLLKIVFPAYTGADTGKGRRERFKEESLAVEKELSAVEKERWRKRDGDTLYSSTNGKGRRSGSSSGSSRRNTNSLLFAVRHETGCGCWSFLRRKNS